MRSMRKLLSGVPITSDEPTAEIISHPKSTLDAQASRLMKARHAVLQLDLDIQRTRSQFKAALADIEAHYTEQVDSVERQYRERSGDLESRYRDAHAVLQREQNSMKEQLKAVDCRAEFIDHFPAPKPEPAD